jgi:hypothetical protein
LAYHAYEALKPGWYQRTNEMMKRQQGRTMIGYKGPGSKPGFIPPQIRELPPRTTTPGA